MVSVLGNLEVGMLFRLERVSKSFQSIIRINGVLRTGVLNSFQGITNVPEVTDYEVYAHILKTHYECNKCSAVCWHKKLPIAVEHAKHHLAFLGNDGDRLLSSTEFDAIIEKFYENSACSFETLKGRKLVLEYTKDWKTEIYSRMPSVHNSLPIFHNTEAIIDRISAIASSKFCFYSSDDEKKLFPHGMIGTDGNLVLELWRHQTAMTAYHENPNTTMHQILFSMNRVSHLLAHPEEEENNDEEEEEDLQEEEENNDEEEEEDLQEVEEEENDDEEEEEDRREEEEEEEENDDEEEEEDRREEEEEEEENDDEEEDQEKVEEEKED